MQRAGLRVVIVTGRVSESVRLRAVELDVDDVAQDPRAHKLPAFLGDARPHGIAPSEAAFVGDDFPDLAVLRLVGLPVAVGNAVPEIRAACTVRLTRHGGRGAIREFAELLLKARGQWDQGDRSIRAGALAPSGSVRPMMPSEILERGRRVIRLEREALATVEERLGESFSRAVSMIAHSTGRVIVAGVGKSGLVGRKIARRSRRPGRRRSFSIRRRSAHGDLGIVGADDVAILISKSGESDELLVLLEHLQGLGVRTIAITGESRSRCPGSATLHWTRGCARKPARTISRRPPARRPHSPWAMRSP
jgi:YrbI family 3-deoxy-D-manno-octulosonate 8-phosphate phosphatase